LDEHLGLLNAEGRALSHEFYLEISDLLSENQFVKVMDYLTGIMHFNMLDPHGRPMSVDFKIISRSISRQQLYRHEQWYDTLEHEGIPTLECLRTEVGIRHPFCIPTLLSSDRCRTVAVTDPRVFDPTSRGYPFNIPGLDYGLRPVPPPIRSPTHKPLDLSAYPPGVNLLNAIVEHSVGLNNEECE